MPRSRKRKPKVRRTTSSRDPLALHRMFDQTGRQSPSVPVPRVLHHYTTWAAPKESCRVNNFGQRPITARMTRPNWRRPILSSSRLRRSYAQMPPGLQPPCWIRLLISIQGRLPPSQLNTGRASGAMENGSHSPRSSSGPIAMRRRPAKNWQGSWQITVTKMEAVKIRRLPFP
jgi:hypothetical protein